MKKTLLIIQFLLATIPTFAGSLSHNYFGKGLPENDAFGSDSKASRLTSLSANSDTPQKINFSYYYEGGSYLLYEILDRENRTCQVEAGTSDKYAANKNAEGDVIIPSVAIDKEDGVEYTVVAIGDYSFARNTKMTSVTIPETVTSIGKGAFLSTNITSVTIPNSVKSISSQAFQGSDLQNVKIGDSVRTIGFEAFECNRLKKIEFSSLESFFNIEFMNGRSANPFHIVKDLVVNGEVIKDLVVPETVETIYSWALSDCRSIESVTIPNSVRSIGYSAFYECSNLKSLSMGDSVTTINDNAFKGCTSLKSNVTIPRKVKYIGDDAFRYCQIPELTYNAENCEYCGSYKNPAFPLTIHEVTMGDKIRKIPNYAFVECSPRIVNISSLENWLNIQFEGSSSNPVKQGWVYQPELRLNGEVLRHVDIPYGITHLNPYVFDSCSTIESISFPETFESIGSNTLYYGLKRVEFPNIETFLGLNYENYLATFKYSHKDCKIYIDSVEFNPTELDWPISLIKIPDYTFYNYNNLKKINIPETVCEIGELAFFESGLESIDIPEGVIEIGANAFTGCSDLAYLKIPTSLISAGEGAFSYCPSLSEIHYVTNNPRSWSYSIFSDETYRQSTLFVSEEAKEICQVTEPWDKFVNIKTYDDNNVDEIKSGLDLNLPYEVYTLNGRLVSYDTENLTPGIYVVRQGSESKKITIK